MKKIITDTAFLSALFLFIGYLNVFLYYDYFGINITTYLSTGELLLSFLPITTPLLIMLVVVFFPMLEVLTTQPDNNSTATMSSIRRKDKFKVSLINLKKAIKIIRQKRVRKRFALLLFFIQEATGLIFGFLFHVYFMLFILFFIVSVFATERRFPIPIAVWIILTIVWFAFLDDQIIPAYRKSERVNSVIIAIGVILSLGLISIYNRDKADDVLRGNQTMHVHFVYDSSRISTDTNLVYVGQTNGYIFLRNRTSRTNRVFELSKISGLEFTLPPDKSEK